MITLFEQQVLDYFNSLNCKSILMAFSGGRDSTALLDCLIQHQSVLGILISACHVNHSIRGDAAEEDAAFCKAYCEKKNIPFYLKTVDVPAYARKHSESMESAARILRYEALFELKSQLNADAIVTAHHKDDKVETFFIKLFQGASILNMSGYSYAEDELIRPLLNVNRSDIDHHVNQHAIDHIEDETNRSDLYLRNWVRRHMLHPIRLKDGAFVSNILNFQNESEQFKDYLEQNTASILIDESDGVSWQIDRNRFDECHLIEKKFILAKLLQNCFRLESRHIDEILKYMDAKSSKRFCLPNEYQFEVSYNKIVLLHMDTVKPFEIHVEWGKGEFFISHLNKMVLLNGFSDKDNITIRNRRNGDRFMNKKLKDIFIDKKIELFIRDTSIVLENNGSIVWVENISKNNDHIIVCNRGRH